MLSRGISPGIFTCFLTIASISFYIPLSLLLEETNFTFDQNVGFFCFLSSKELFFYCFAAIGAVCFLSSFYAVKAMQIVSPLLLSTSYLFTFVPAAMFAWMLNINEFPNAVTWAAGGTVIFGLFFIIYGE